MLQRGVRRRAYSGYSDPTWEEKAWIAETACEFEDASGEVGVAGVDGEESDHGCLRSVVDQPILVSSSFPHSLKLLNYTISTSSNL